jgi:alanyl-tRNA synthetase
MKYTTDELRTKWLAFYEAKGHKIIPSAGVIPDNDPTALFHNSGMHPLVPYLMGEVHPEGVRLVNSQKCVRTGDIEEVGDATHLTFFEMLGNWSLGDYGKEEQIKWSFEFLTEVLELSLDKIAVSVFAGDDDAPRDEEAAKAWKDCGIDEKRIAYLGKEDNWWAKGDVGPCGPDSEMFYWSGDEPAPENFQETADNPLWVEIWNDVFMTFHRDDQGVLHDLPQQNIDTGMGLERTVAILNGFKSVYQTDAFADILKTIAETAGKPALADDPLADTEDGNSLRIIADHLRAATVMLAEAIAPSNTDQGYILRRIIRRAIRHGRKIGIEGAFCNIIAKVVITKLSSHYSELKKHEAFVFEELTREEALFSKTLTNGEREFEKLVSSCHSCECRNLDPRNKSEDDKVGVISGKSAFNLYETYGFPLEMTMELAQEKGMTVDEDGFCKAQEMHQQKSRAGAEKKFQGGLGDTEDATVKLHTAAHLMVAAMREVLGEHISQRGSNITPERLRFDFSHDEKLTDDQKSAIEKWVNEAIAADAEQIMEEIPKAEAENDPTIVGAFWEKYPDTVKVYSFKDATGKIWSRELCGGPHWKRTGDLGTFKIKKEESSSRGVRRIKALLV